MTSVVLDASAVIALVRDEPGADRVAEHLGNAVISAVNLQEVVKALLLRGFEIDVIREILENLRLDIRSHDSEAAFASALLVGETAQYGRGLGDRTCMALGIALACPVLTTDREWKNVKVDGLVVEHLR